MSENLQGDAADGLLGDLGEHGIARLAEQGGTQAQQAIGEEQEQRQHQHGVVADVEGVDDVLQHQRHRHVGDLGHDQQAEGEQHPAPVFPQIREQLEYRAPFSLAAGGRRAGRCHGADMNRLGALFMLVTAGWVGLVYVMDCLYAGMVLTKNGAMLEKQICDTIVMVARTRHYGDVAILSKSI